MAKFDFESYTLPVFPLGTVLYPGSRLPLKLFEARYLDMAKRCLKDNLPFVITSIVEGKEIAMKDEASAIPSSVGTLAMIGEWDMQDQGILLITAHGKERVSISETSVEADRLLTGRIHHLPLADQRIPEHAFPCAKILQKMISQIGVERFAAPFLYGDAGWVSFRLAEILPLRLDVKQKLLELDDAVQRLAILQKFLTQQGLISDQA